jgi:hypothetical protein
MWALGVIPISGQSHSTPCLPRHTYQAIFSKDLLGETNDQDEQRPAPSWVFELPRRYRVYEGPVGS